MLPILAKLTVIALKNTTVRTFLDCLSGDVMMKSVNMYQKVTKQICIFNCNTVKCSAELTAKVYS